MNPDFQALKTGYYKDIDDDEYFGLKVSPSGLLVASNSTIGHLLKSPAHLQKELSSAQERTPAMNFGSAYHLRILEPDIFNMRVMNKPQCFASKGNGERCSNPATYFKTVEEAFCGTHVPRDKDKDLLEGFSATAASGIIFLTQGEMDKLEWMADAIFNHEFASALLQGDSREGVVVWTDPETGIPCRGKIDHWNTDLNVLVDLKTTKSALPHSFQKALYEFGYYRQGPMYIDGLAHAGTRLKDFCIIAQEKEPPFSVGTYILDDEAMTVGRYHYQDLLLKFKKFQDSMKDDGLFKKLLNCGYTNEIRPISLPAWSVDSIYNTFEINQ
tara:strand:+ start:12597 stop:13580 length:984 start_codon:yes stop_codon:yes gene_type:complete